MSKSRSVGDDVDLFNSRQFDSLEKVSMRRINEVPDCRSDVT
jgi:hypothetical protein